MSLHSSMFEATAHTEFLDTDGAARLVAGLGVIACLRGMTQAIEADFLRWPAFELRARTATHSADGVIELMPVSDSEGYGFKYVNGHPANTRRGLPTVMAFGALADVATGAPVFLSELTLTTAIRTAATSVMAARRLARPDARSMALIGNGSQSEFQALAFVGLLDVRELRLFDVDPSATAKLMRNLAPFAADLGLDIRVCASTREAVRGADIVTTVTADKAMATILQGDMIEPGMHVNAVGGDCPGKTELSPDVLRGASVFVEYETQTRHEGDIQQMPAGFAVTELWRVLTGEAPGRRSAQEVTVFDSVGFALEDYAAMRFMREAARQAGVLQAISLVPALTDPRDLFHVLVRANPAGEPVPGTTQPKAVTA